MKNLPIKIMAAAFLLITGCQSVPKNAPHESQQDTISAIGTVTQGLTNKNLTEQDLKNLAGQIQKDPEAKSAIESVNNAFHMEQTGVKYCPKDGKRFNSRVKYCPDDGTELKDLN